MKPGWCTRGETNFNTNSEKIVCPSEIKNVDRHSKIAPASRRHDARFLSTFVLDADVT